MSETKEVTEIQGNILEVIDDFYYTMAGFVIMMGLGFLGEIPEESLLAVAETLGVIIEDFRLAVLDGEYSRKPGNEDESP